MSDPVASDSTASDKPADTERSAGATEVVPAAATVSDTRPKIGDTRPAPAAPARDARPKIGDTRAPRGAAPATDDGAATGEAKGDAPRRRRRRGGRGRGGGGGQGTNDRPTGDRQGTNDRGLGDRGGAGSAPTPVEARLVDDDPIQLDEKTLKRRRGRERKGRPVGRYMMCVSVRPNVTQIAVLEGRSLVEHYVSRPADETTEIHGNIYLGRVQNVLPGMEAAFVDIGTPKNAVLYRGDVQYDPDDIEAKSEPRIEQLLQAKQKILCQVTKNPIAHKGARLTQEVSLPGRFVVLIPNSSTIGISKRLPDNERRRLRNLLDKVRPAGHGLILRTAAENVTADEIERDVNRLVSQWNEIDKLANTVNAPALLYREPDMALRVIREEFNADYRGVVIDDESLFEQVRDYVSAISPALADRIEYFDRTEEPLPLFERHHVHEQIHKALDRKVWLTSGGSLIIEHTEALTVIDVNTGKNVGSSSLEETVFRNNLEAADEIARQLRLRDIGGIIVIDFVDMERRENRDAVVRTFRDALARDKTRTQVFDISDLGLVEMTRKRIGEGLLESISTVCPECEGRGLKLQLSLLE
ncbi:MAG: Rne/Rng family ribonuclease [Acidimicrobiales bacterium]